MAISANEIIVGGGIAFVVWRLLDSDNQPTSTDDGLLPIPDPDSYEWRNVTEVGTNTDGVTFSVQGLYVITDEGVEESPKADRHLWRAVQSANGVSTPFSGRNEFGGLDGSGWGVPYDDALTSAESRFNSSGGTGPINPTPEEPGFPGLPGIPEGGSPLTPQFPDLGAGSFEGFNLGGASIGGI